MELTKLLDSASSVTKWKTQKATDDALDIATSYGRLITTVRLPLIDGEVFNWKVANPFALLYELQHGYAP